MLFFFLGIVLEAQEKQWFYEKPVEQILFEGLVTVSETELEGLVSTYLLKPFTDGLLWEIQNRLYALEYFELVLPHVLEKEERKEDAVVLLFEVKERPSVVKVVIEGNESIYARTLKEEISLKRGDFVSKARLRADEKVLRERYINDGYLDVQISSTMDVEEATNTVAVTFLVKEGKRMTVKEVLFQGNRAIPSDRLEGLMKTRAPGIFGKKKRYHEGELQEDIEALERYYGERGYLDIKVEDVKKRIIFDEKKGVKQLILTLVISEGEVFTYGGVTFVGNLIYTTEELLNLIQQQEGAVFNTSRFLLDFQRVVDLYQNKGYIFNEITHREIRDNKTRIVSYEISIHEKDRAHIGAILIRGNTKTKDAVILREIPFEEGEVFSSAKLRQSVNNLFSTGFFSSVHPQPRIGEDENEGLMELLYEVEERRTLSTVFGMKVGGSADFPVSLFANLVDKNLLGRGWDMSLEFDLSQSTQRVGISFKEPYLFGFPWEGEITFDYTHISKNTIAQDLDGNGLPDPQVERGGEGNRFEAGNPRSMNYETQGIAFRPSMGYVWAKSLGRLGVYTGFSFAGDFVDYDATNFRPWSKRIRHNHKRWLYSDSWNIGISWDTRDGPVNPSRGFYIKENFSLFGLLPVSIKDFTKTETLAKYYYTLYNLHLTERWSLKTVLHLRTSFTYLGYKTWSPEGLDLEQDGLVIDGVFVGRGWARKRGGKILWDSSLELRTPLVENLIAFDLFFDSIGIWNSDTAFGNMQASDFRFGIGGGFRIDNLQFPIAVYLVKKFNIRNGSINWDPEPGTYNIGGGAKMNIMIAFSSDFFYR